MAILVAIIEKIATNEQDNSMSRDLALKPITAVTISSDRRAANLQVLLASKSANTQAQIKSTWGMYSAWCEAAGVGLWELDAVQAQAFLTAHPARPSTQRARLSHLRTVLGLNAETSGLQAMQYRYAMLKLYTLPNDANNPMFAEPRHRREKRALHQEEIYSELQRQWATPELTTRNRAIIAILFYAGLRRSEVVKLKWADVNWQDKTLAIKGAKKRAADHVDYVPLLPQAEKYLKAWQTVAGAHEYVFVSISKGGKLLADKPMSGEALRRHVCGKEFMPHDARRTLGTRSIEAGTPTNYTQKILRHKTAAQTLKYAEYIETKELSDKVKLGY